MMTCLIQLVSLGELLDVKEANNRLKIRDAKQFWKKAVSTPKLELISEIAFNSMKQSFALENFRPILPFL